MSRSRGPDRESSTDGAPERAEEADYDAPSSDAGGAAEHAAAPQLDSGMVGAMASGSESPIVILLKSPKFLSSGRRPSWLSSAYWDESDFVPLCLDFVALCPGSHS